MLTTADLLGDLGFRMLVGEASAELPVSWVHISELLDPTPWMSGGEILLTTGLLLDDEATQRAYVSRLADHGLSALGFGTGFRHAVVPAAVLEAAAERALPVFEVPYEVPFIAVTEAAFTRLVNEQYAVLRRLLVALERLERIVLSERGLEALAGALAKLIGASVIVFGPRGEPLVQGSFRNVLGPDVLAKLGSEVAARAAGAARPAARIFIPEIPDDAAALVLAVAAEEGSEATGALLPLAWLAAVKDVGPFSDFDRLTLRQAVSLVALELLRARVAGDTERRLAGDVLAGLLSGELRGAELARRLAPFGICDGVHGLVCSMPRARPGTAEDVFEAAVRAEAGTAIAAHVDGLVYVLVPALPEEEALAQARRVGAKAAERLGVELRIGVGRPVPVPEARQSFNEARCALETLVGGGEGSRDEEPVSANGRNRGANGGQASARRVRVAGHRDLGSFKLLLSLQEDESLRIFCDSILQPLEAAEGEYGEELLRSLEAYIEENGQWERAARRLPCHRHTLRYRIRRIEQLTGRDLSSARDRIDFWLALRGRELMT